jgi:hypothetical protein
MNCWVRRAALISPAAPVRTPRLKIQIDTLDFNLLAACRLPLIKALSNRLISISGDSQLAGLARKNTNVLY